MFTGLKEEKKVEYLELIYDLIFVYNLGRNNMLLTGVENGFVAWESFAAYILSSLAVIQIWNFSTFYMNRFGRNGVRDHVWIIINMYLLYYMGQGTSMSWADFRTRYHVAWALILINIAIQYILEMRNQRGDEDLEKAIRNMVIVLFGEAAIVLLAIPVEDAMGFPVCTMLAIVFGIFLVWLLPTPEDANLVDFRHLTERAMLYVVFTFGEMIIALAGYFEGSFNVSTAYFSLMGFLIVVGLFLSYEMFYNRIVDKNLLTSGREYMLIHVFLVFGMNNLTNALEFMREEEMSLLPKTIFLISSFLLFYLCLFALFRYAKRQMRLRREMFLLAGALSVIFAAGMLLLREQMLFNIAFSVVYVGSMFFLIFRFGRLGSRTRKALRNAENVENR